MNCEATREVTLSTTGELEERRLQVLRLRHRRMSEGQIARALNVSASTVSRDLEYVRAHWQDFLGPDQTFDRAVFIGETLARYEDVESTAMHESARAGISIKDKMRCLQVAMIARTHQVALLEDSGIISRSPVALTVGLPSAAQIRAAVEAATLDDDRESSTVFDVAS